MLRVGNMRRSVNFYTRMMGMRVLRTFEQPDEKYSLTFLGFGDESDTCVLELTYNYGVSQYDLGTAYGHLAIGVNECHQACAEIIAFLVEAPVAGTPGPCRHARAVAVGAVVPRRHRRGLLVPAQRGAHARAGVGRA